ncbi:hypothetical protein [Polyangium fumosum]|nr:hypothetical protein [Polyangium fumosum]
MTSQAGDGPRRRGLLLGSLVAGAGCADEPPPHVTGADAPGYEVVPE